MRKKYLFFKRVFDFVFSCITLVVLAPLFLIIGLLIKLDSKGPIFFRQERLGKGGRIFKIYKFRTMCDKAETIGSGIFTYENDSRITRVGKILRKTSLDEIPQIINIIKGEMSFIGPRPPVPYYPYEYKDYPDFSKVRFDVLPGITGLAQIHGRTTYSWDERFKFDIDYVKDISLWLDIKIFCLTIFKVLLLKDIYRSKNEALETQSIN